MNRPLLNRVRHSLSAALVLFTISVIGYMWLEQFSFADALYMTVITLSTVGFGEIQPLSPAGRIFTAGIIVVGVILIAVLFGTLTEYIIAGELGGTLKTRRLMKKMRAINNHYIVCGMGRVGEHVAVELQNRGLPCVVIDKEKATIEHAEQLGLTAIQGDATIDETLQDAGIEKAKGLVAALNTDAENLFVILSARKLNPDLTIVGRSTMDEATPKLQMAGADRVVSPYDMAGHRIVSQLTRPHVTFFLDSALYNKGLNLFIDEIQIAPQSPLVSQSMSEAEIRSRTGANIISILRGDEHEVMEWSPELAIQPGDMLIVVGKLDQLHALADLAGDTRFQQD